MTDCPPVPVFGVTTTLIVLVPPPELIDVPVNSQVTKPLLWVQAQSVPLAETKVSPFGN